MNTLKLMNKENYLNFKVLKYKNLDFLIMNKSVKKISKLKKNNHQMKVQINKMKSNKDKSTNKKGKLKNKVNN
jgi:cell division protein FtsB